jgi:hypothetical protein
MSDALSDAADDDDALSDAEMEDIINHEKFLKESEYYDGSQSCGSCKHIIHDRERPGYGRYDYFCGLAEKEYKVTHAVEFEGSVCKFYT